MAKLLIAGFGFLGEALNRRFVADGWQVDGMSRRGGVDARVCDLTSAGALAGWQGDYDLVIHCAATGGGDADAYRAVYREGSRHLLARFPKTPMIFISSSSVYGQTDHSEVTEMSAADPDAETGKVLREAEQLVLDAGGAVVRLSALCGPKRCYTLKTLLNGNARLDGQGERVLNYIHRDDAAAACAVLARHWRQASGCIFNVSAASLTQLQCYQMLASAYNRPLPERRGVEAQSGLRRRGQTSKWVNSAKVKALGWSPEYGDILSIARASDLG